MVVKRVSTDTTFEFFFDFKTGQYREVSEIESSPAQAPRQAALTLSGGEYVVPNFQAKHRIRVVISIDDGEKEALVRFMSPPLPTNSLYWPSREVECSVPLLHILLELSSPIVTSSSGRIYKVTADD